MAKRKTTARIVAVLGRKGGIGKTTIASGIAALLAEKGPTLLVDLDPQGSASTALGLELASDGLEAVDVAQKLAVIRGGPVMVGIDPQDLAARIRQACATLPRLRVVLDCPPGSVEQEALALAVADTALAVVVNETLALHSFALALAAVEGRRAAVVANRLRETQVERFTSELGAEVDLPVFAVRTDAVVAKMQARGLPLTAAPTSKALEDLRKVLAWLG